MDPDSRHRVLESRGHDGMGHPAAPVVARLLRLDAARAHRRRAQSDADRDLRALLRGAHPHPAHHAVPSLLRRGQQRQEQTEQVAVMSDVALCVFGFARLDVAKLN